MSFQVIRHDEFFRPTGSLTLYNPANGDIVHKTDNLSENSVVFATEAEEIRTGGGKLKLSLFHTPDVTVNFTEDDFSPNVFAVGLGSAVEYGAQIMVSETVTLSSGGVGQVISQPVAQYGVGDCVVRARVRKATDSLVEVVEFDSTDGVYAKTFTIENGIEGDIYCVEYYAIKDSAKQITVKDAMNGGVYIAVIGFDIFSNKGSADSASGSKSGEMNIVIPRFQVQPGTTLGGNTTTHSTSAFVGKAIGYKDACVSGLDPTSCESTALLDLCRIVINSFDETQVLDDAKAILVMGGGIEVEAGAVKQIPLKLLMANGSIIQPPDFGAFEYTVADTNVATVSESGVITGGTEGNTSVTITHATYTKFKFVADVDVISD